MSDNKLTIFDPFDRKEVQEAINSLIRGTTPITSVRKRPIRGGGEVNYVNTYYMTRQATLITGARWSSECKEERFIPDDKNPREIGAKMRVTIWDRNNNQYWHESWGSSEIKRYVKDDPKGHYKAGDIIAIFDDIKGAYSDGIKKCLSYFGIANDVYGGRDLDYFGEEPGADVSSSNMSSADESKAFMRYISEQHILPSKAMQILGISSWSEITDWKLAYNIIKGGI